MHTVCLAATPQPNTQVAAPTGKHGRSARSTCEGPKLYRRKVRSGPDPFRVMSHPVESIVRVRSPCKLRAQRAQQVCAPARCRRQRAAAKRCPAAADTASPSHRLEKKYSPLPCLHFQQLLLGGAQPADDRYRVRRIVGQAAGRHAAGGAAGGATNSPGVAHKSVSRQLDHRALCSNACAPGGCIHLHQSTKKSSIQIIKYSIAF